MDDVAGIQRSSGVRTFRRYKADAAKLDSYAFDVNKIVEPLSISVWDAYSELVSLASTTALDFPIDSVEKYSQEDLDSQIELIDSYAKSLNELGHDFDKSPWKDAKNAWVTNEYLYRACESAANVATSSYNLSRLQLRANQILGCNLPQTYGYGCRIENLLNSLALCLSSECGVPVDDPHTLLDCVTSLNAFEKANYSRITELSQLVKSATADNNGIGGNTEDFNGIEAVVRSISDIFSCDDNYRNWLSKDINFIIELSKQLSSQLSELRELKTKILQEYISGILDLDARSMLVRFSTKYSKPFGRISKSYREDTSALIALQRNITSEKPSFERQIDLLNSVCRIQELKSDLRVNSNKYEAYFGCLFSGEDTDVGKIQHAVVIFNNLKVIDDKARYLLSIDREAVRSADKISRDIGSRYAKFDTDFENLEFQISNLCKLTDIASSCEIEDVQELAASCDISLVHDVAKKLHDELDAFREACKVLSKYSEQNLFSDDYADIVSRLREQSEDRRELERVLECKHDFAICKEAGLEGFLSAASMAHLEPDELTKGYMRQFYSCWLKAILPGNGSVINFRKNDQESASKDFCDTDKAMIFAARDNVLRSLYSAVSGVVDDIDSKRLHREASKRSHIMPIRKVFDEMPGLVSTLKPCVMMSPLSVSTFLEKRSILFDLVVFDEASQVRTEDAVGAISRGRQVIIAGDSNQLPPTNFFNIGTDDDDIDYEDGGDFDNGDFESVLEEASLLPTINLKWHYRSRNESLITFSNREIYDNSLVTFPSVSEYLPGQGVIFDYVDGGVWGGSQRGNETEAKRVAKLVFLHLEQYPERSLGVIAFGDGQARCIESEINSLRAKYKMFESRFDDKNPGCIFVKSLENVQGDERDSIILSVGYAKDAGGRLRMNFGPLNRRGGERRLNVAITRAKVDLTLVSSILDTDINLSNTSSKGARLLQRYISYARHKKQLHANKTRDQFSSDSHGGIRQFIKYELNARGYIVEFNVGDSSCKIDIAVKSDRDPSVYIAGILTDGPSYASVAYTRERERILPDALKNTGWNLYRAWIPAWAHNPSGELEDLLEFISKCASSFDGRTSDSCTRTRASAHEPEESPKACLNIDETPSINAGGHNIPARLHSEAVSHSVCKATQTMGEPGNRRLPTGQLKTNTNKECSSRKHGHKKHMRDLSSYQLAEGSWDKFGFQEYKAVPEIPSNVSLGEAVLRFVGAEGPTTNDRVLSFIRKRLGREASLREARIALDRLEDKYTGIGLVVSGDFIRLEGIRDQAPRKGGRLFSEIPPEEIAEGMLRVLRVLSTGGKTTKNDLFDVTYDEFGFSRDDQISPEALRSLNKTYEILRAAGFIVDVGPLHIASREAFEEFE